MPNNKIDILKKNIEDIGEKDQEERRNKKKP